jgi:hypothetical protein
MERSERKSRLSNSSTVIQHITELDEVTRFDVTRSMAKVLGEDLQDKNSGEKSNSFEDG